MNFPRTLVFASLLNLLSPACERHARPPEPTTESGGVRTTTQTGKATGTQAQKHGADDSAAAAALADRSSLPSGAAPTADTGTDAAPTESSTVRRPDVVYVPTPQPVVDKMLQVAKVKKGDVVYDLGCGDGRIVVTAAKRYGVRAFGFDVDPERIAEARENVKKNGVEELVTIEQKDIFTVDLSPASVVTLYLLPRLNVKLIPQLEKLKPGSRIVSHDFDMKGVTPARQLDVPADDRNHSVYLWTAPLKKDSAVVMVAP